MPTVGIYTRKSIWNPITSGQNNWWGGLPFWVAAYGVPNDGTIPPWPDGPFPVNGKTTCNIWQYSSEGQNVTDWDGDGLDLNIVGPYPPNSPAPPPPPTGKAYDTSFMRAEPGIWRVVRRSDGSGEDIWELPLDSQNDVRVKNANEGEWYFYGNGGVWRTRDTSPAPQSDGTARLYLLNDGSGGQIAPNEATVGVTYAYTNQVQFKAKSNCANLAENSGTAVSTFLLKEVIQNYTFPTTGFTVDWLYVTVQTGETQLYAVHDGRRYGWVGGGASQDNNVWGGSLAEVYYDRAIPPAEPPKFCV